MEQMRSNYHLNTETINEKTAIDLAARSDKPLLEVRDLLDFIVHLKNKKQHSEQDVLQLNIKLNQFKK
ncbi:MAG: hypothetical protein R2814_01020 [Flavobacteriaceae bacterium]